MARHLELSCALRSLHGGSITDRLDLVADYGISSVELRLSDLDPQSPSGFSPSEFRSALDRTGISVGSCEVTTGLSHWSEAEPLLRERIEQAGEFRPAVIVGDGGSLDDDPDEVLPGIRRLADQAARLGMRYCIELQAGLCSDHRRLLAMVEAVGHPAVRASFDTGSLHYLNGPIEGEVALARVCHKLGHVRLRDTSGEAGAWHFPALGHGGAVNFIRVRELSVHSGFLGPFVIAADGIAGDAVPESDVDRRMLRDSLRTLRDCGFLDPVFGLPE